MENFQENRDQPRMNLLLFGVPGAGKTEFVKYLARQLDKPLCVKNAGNLLSCYVGETEERINSAFAEAEANGEILFIDEGDSLLSSRERARENWEVSQVNTLLSEMERFRGIFIVGTNLIQRLDQAALRRFSFRLHFDYLTSEGKEIFYRMYFQPLRMPELTESEKKSLHDIDQMTPSDFRNVRQQFFYLEDSELTNAEIIEASNCLKNMEQKAHGREKFHKICAGKQSSIHKNNLQRNHIGTTLRRSAGFQIQNTRFLCD